MTEDINKGSKRQPRNLHLHYHYYRNQNKPLAGDAGLEAPGGGASMGPAEQNASLSANECMDSDQANKNASNVSVIGTGHGDPRSASRPAVTSPAIGNPVASPDFNRMRLSEPLAAGHAAYSNQDHGVGAGRNPDLAVGVNGRNIQQGRTESYRTDHLTTVNGDVNAGDTSRNVTYMQGRVSVQHLDLAGAAGRFDGMQDVSHSPQRPDWHQERTSATPDNGSHSLNHPQSTYMQSMKSQSPVDVMRALQQRMG